MKLNTKIAFQRRHVRRIEEDWEPFQLRIADASAEAQEKLKQWFRGIVASERKVLEELERQQ